MKLNERNVETLDLLIKEVNKELKLINRYSYEQTEEIKKEGTNIDLVELYNWAQYFERKGFEIRCIIEQYTIGRKQQFDEALKFIKGNKLDFNGDE